MKPPAFIDFLSTSVLTRPPLAPAPPKKTAAGNPCALGRHGTSGRRLFYAATVLPDNSLKQCNANNRALFTLVAAILRTLGRIGRLCLTPIQCPAPRSLFWPEPFGDRSGDRTVAKVWSAASCFPFCSLKFRFDVHTGFIRFFADRCSFSALSEFCEVS